MAGTELESHTEVIWCTSEQPVNLVNVTIIEYLMISAMTLLLMITLVQ